MPVFRGLIRNTELFREFWSGFHKWETCLLIQNVKWSFYVQVYIKRYMAFRRTAFSSATYPRNTLRTFHLKHFKIKPREKNQHVRTGISIWHPYAAAMAPMCWHGTLMMFALGFSLKEILVWFSEHCQAPGFSPPFSFPTMPPNLIVLEHCGKLKGS